MSGHTDPASVLLVVGDASETLDTLYPYYRLQEAGFEPVVAGPEKRVFQMVMHEVRPGWTITREWEGYQIKADIAFAEVDPDDYLGVFYSGGRAPEYIRYDEHLVRITRSFFAGVGAAASCASSSRGVSTARVPAAARSCRSRRACRTNQSLSWPSNSTSRASLSVARFTRVAAGAARS